jgi:hypothetical protein
MIKKIKHTSLYDRITMNTRARLTKFESTTALVQREPQQQQPSRQLPLPNQRNNIGSSNGDGSDGMDIQKVQKRWPEFGT